VQLEIERKFIASPAVLAVCRQGTAIEQGYLVKNRLLTLRVRLSGGVGILTLKLCHCGCSCLEHEIRLYSGDARGLLARLPPAKIIRKTRYRVPVGARLWDVDVFEGLNQGLIMAEVELERPGQLVELPQWVVREVTGDRRYHNSSLALNPYRLWLGGGATKAAASA